MFKFVKKMNQKYSLFLYESSFVNLMKNGMLFVIDEVNKITKL